MITYELLNECLNAENVKLIEPSSSTKQYQHGLMNYHH